MTQHIVALIGMDETQALMIKALTKLVLFLLRELREN